MKIKIFTLIAGMLMSASLFAQIHHLPLTSNADDIVGDLNGTETGITYATDTERGEVAIFDGSAGSSFISIPSFLNGKTEVSISIWFKQNVGNTWSRIYSLGIADNIATNQHNGCTNHHTLVAHNPNGRTEYLVKNPAVPCDWYAWPGEVDVVTIGEWHHSVVTLTENYVTMYLDGKKISEQAIFDNPFLMSDVGNVLGRAYWPDPDVQAAMSDFRIYDNVLTDTEVAALYVETEKSTTEIVSGFSMKNITDNSATAVALLNNTGTTHVIINPAGLPAPTIDEVKASTSAFPCVANVPLEYPLVDLDPNSAFDFYFIAENESNVFQAEVTKVSLKVLADKTIEYHWPLAGDVIEANQTGENATIQGTVVFEDDALRGKQVAVLNKDLVYDNSDPDNIIDNTDGYIELPQFVGGLEEMTVGMWYRIDQAIHWSKFFSIGEGGRDGDPGYRDGFWAAPVSGFDFNIEETGKFSPWYHASATPEIIVGEWHHAAFVISDDQKVKMYLDGIEIGSMTMPKPIGEINDINNYLGKSYWSDAHFKGAFSDVKIYSRALSESELAEEFGLTLSISDNIISPVRIYPNPTKGEVTFKAKEYSSVEMFNTLGQSVLKLEGGKDMQVNTRKFNAGIYLVRFSNKDTAVTKRLVIE